MKRGPAITITGMMAGSAAIFSEHGVDVREQLRERIAGASSVALEIGFGHAFHLVQLAQANPDTLVVGMEVQQRWVKQAYARAEREGVENLFALKADARVLLTVDLAPASLDHVFVLFPDPWWKPRHRRRRRMVTPEFLDVLTRALRPGGHFVLRTDVKAYMEVSAAFVSSHPAFSLVTSGDHWGHGLTTRRERKCVDAGLSIYEQVWVNG